VIQRQLGHADLGITSAYLRAIDNTEIIHAAHERPAPMIPGGARHERRPPLSQGQGSSSSVTLTVGLLKLPKSAWPLAF
jgi:hypothetical protein